MKKLSAIAVSALLIASFAGSAWAGGRGHGHFRHHGRVGITIGLGIPLVAGAYYGPQYLYGPRYYSPPPYYYYGAQPVVVAPVSPPVYVEQSDPQIASNQGTRDADYWYYCKQPQGYYPYVRECAGGWQAVPPRPQERR